MPAKPLPCPRCQFLLPMEIIGAGAPILCPSCNTRLVLKDASPDSLVWYFARDKQDKAGPFSWVQMRQLAEQGLLPPTGHGLAQRA